MNSIELSNLYDQMKPSAFIVAELEVLLARVETAENAISHLPVITPQKYARALIEIRQKLSDLRGEMLAEQSEHQKRINELFGVRDDTIPF